MVRMILILMLAALHALVGIPDYLQGTGQYWMRALTYSFFHASWWHLAVNGIAIWTIFDPRRKVKMPQVPLVAFFIAVLVYPLSFRPVIGFSNVIYAVLGLRTPPLSSPSWKQPSVIAFLIITVALLFVPRFSATTHIAAFLLGMAGAAIQRSYHNITQDARRYL